MSFQELAKTSSIKINDDSSGVNAGANLFGDKIIPFFVAVGWVEIEVIKPLQEVIIQFNEYAVRVFSSKLPDDPVVSDYL